MPKSLYLNGVRILKTIKNTIGFNKFKFLNKMEWTSVFLKYFFSNCNNVGFRPNATFVYCIQFQYTISNTKLFCYG